MSLKIVKFLYHRAAHEVDITAKMPGANFGERRGGGEGVVAVSSSLRVITVVDEEVEVEEILLMEVGVMCFR